MAVTGSTELLTATQMRVAETAVIDGGRVSGLELMEHAGRGVVEAIFEEWPALQAAPHRAVILCGPGNNGGDGFVVARMLKGWGWQVDVFLLGDPANLPPDARVNHDKWIELDSVRPAVDAEVQDLIDMLGRGDLVIDALFGTGLTRPVDVLGGVLRGLNDMAGEGLEDRDWPYVVAVDIVSGFCADSGRYLTDDELNAHAFAPFADLTVTFHRAKRGHFQGLCAEASGTLAVKPIGLDRHADLMDTALMSLHGLGNDSPGLARHITTVGPDLPDLDKGAGRKGAGHKYTHGHALILSGAAGQTGAARLAARGALRIGAGLVTLGVPKAAMAEVAAQITAVMQRCVEGDADLAELLGDARINALCLGPALGTDPRARALIGAVLDTRRPVVLDADALSVLLFDEADALFAKLHARCVLTPHAGEFARLFPDIADRLSTTATSGPAFSKVEATCAAAARAGCVVLFKGPDTVIADPDGRCVINSAHYDLAAPWLATAGSGDVLAGFITGLLARGYLPMHAAQAAARLHLDCARAFGPGLIAEDLPEALPKVLQKLLS